MSCSKNLFILLTGLSGAGKTTISKGTIDLLRQDNVTVFHLDGDVLRTGLNKDLGFSVEDRQENLRRVAEIGALLVHTNILVIASFIAPHQSSRDYIKNKVGSNHFAEVFIDAPISVCEKRDVKGLYKKARKGEINHFTGISAPYEPPINPDLIIDTTKMSEHESIEKLHQFILKKMKQV